MKDVEVKYWGKTPLTNKDVYMLNIVNDDGSKTPVYENDKGLGYNRVLCNKEVANKKRDENMESVGILPAKK
jgi:hypothetical protein